MLMMANLKSYGVAHRELMPRVEHRQSRYPKRGAGGGGGGGAGGGGRCAGTVPREAADGTSLSPRLGRTSPSPSARLGQRTAAELTW